MHGHIVNQICHPLLSSDNTLYVIGVISNTQRFHSRYRLAREWIKAMEATPHVSLKMVEIAYGDRQFEVTEHNNENHLQLRSHQEIWHKENMINLGVARLLPKHWKYVAWIDCDVFFRDSGWALETIQQLQHYPVVQPWSDCVDLGFHGNILQHFKSFCSQHRKHIPKQTHPSQPYQYAHSGFAWACTRYFWENVRHLMEFPILGSADHHMAFGMIGEVNKTVHHGMTHAFKRKAIEWQDAACRVTHGDGVGYLKGRIEHMFHGPKAQRKYRERWQIFVDNKYDPDKDIGYDSQGLIYVLDKPKLLQDCRDYMSQRNEDSIDDY